MKSEKRAVVLLSGGVDSSTALAIARSEGFECFALSFDYAQRHRRELESAVKIAGFFGVKRHQVIRFDLREIGGSALTSELPVPKSGGGNPISDSGQSRNTQSPIPVTYVPARNTIFLSFALSWAEVQEAPDIFIGANIVDYSGYPDCRPEYLNAFENMANLATKVSVEGGLRFRIRAPLLKLTKAEILRKGRGLGVDYSLTWSCYDPQPSKTGLVPCGGCDSCIIRAGGFREAGFPDPLLAEQRSS